MQFDFGANWLAFSRNALTPQRVEQARHHFGQLLSDVELAAKSFLDIGFGQGLALVNAARAGAKPTGCDINPLCRDALRSTLEWCPEVSIDDMGIVVGSILEGSVVSRLREMAPDRDGFDIVHSWGVLHHTGDMRSAVRNAASLVRPGGAFVLALYSRHWSSKPWLWIKWSYCKSPAWLQRVWILSLYPVIWLAKLLVTGSNPNSKQRGMDFYYDVVDWVGGYPYEYASIEEVDAMLAPLGFARVRAIPAEVPTGCNEFVYRRSV